MDDYTPQAIGFAVADLLSAGVDPSDIGDAFKDDVALVVDATENDDPREEPCFFCEYKQLADPGEQGPLLHNCSFHEKG